MSRFHRHILAATLAVLAFGAGRAEAAPQILGLVVAGAGPGRFSPETLAEAAQMVKNCAWFPATGLAQGFCLAGLQRGLMATLNQEYWAAAGGS